MSFNLTIVGRPNVGKSTLYNRLTGTRHALVHDTPGVTRDVREGKGSLGPLEFIVRDTAGLEQAEDGSLASRMTQQTLRAVNEADAVLLVVDGRAGVTPIDRHFAQLLRKTGKPVVLAVNKVEGKAAREGLNDAHTLGLGEPVAISAEHGEGMVELYDALAPYAEKEDEVEAAENPQALSIAIIGRPNVGKSTLINALLKEERVLTGPEAGITRDAIAVPFSWQGREIRLVDTAGMRRKGRVQEQIEQMSVSETLHAIRFAQVVILVLDATLALEKQDNTIASLVEQEGRALVVAINKWDLVPDPKQYMKEFEHRLKEVLAQVKGVTVVPLSAEKKQGLDKLMQAAFDAFELWNTRIPTGQLNRWLESMLEAHAPPLIDGRRLKIRYMTQAKTRPPTFMLSSNLSEVPDHYVRYLTNGMREEFGLQGVPLRIKIKKSKNPYGDEK